MTDILCCAKCKQRLKIVCDAHGTEWVSDRQTTLPPLRKDRPLKLRTLTSIKAPAVTAKSARPATLKSRILAALSADMARPSTAALIAATLGDDVRPKNVGIYLCILANDQQIVRVAPGQYVRADA